MASRWQLERLTGDYLAAAASHRQALKLFCDIGDKRGQAEALNNLGQLAPRALAVRQAFGHHTVSRGTSESVKSWPRGGTCD
jgi:hypothetical protein